jgi:threonine synthase
MRLISTRGQAPAVDFRTALFDGLAPDGGLYVPAHLEPLAALELERLRDASLLDVATAVAMHLIGDEIARDVLHRLLADALNFPIPLRQIDDRLCALELFHGPTFAFKDVGARTMARLMAHFHAAREPLTVLVATSGDTGSAVAQAFFGVEGTRVIVLFPEGQVTRVQEAQFTTLGGNVTAIAVNGTFDDCQRLVKEAFADSALRGRARLTSANSINIGRLLPQMFYYVHAALSRQWTDAVFSVPSGNFGNLTAGLFAWKLGAPIRAFVAATTVNDTLPRYLETGRYEPRPSVSTLANAMDVGDPSNVERMRWLFGEDVRAMRAVVTPSVHTDDDVRAAIGELKSKGYVADPHTAIAYLGTRGRSDDARCVFLATAHPAKFREVVEPVIGELVPLPPALEEALARERKVEKIAPEIGQLAAFI